MATPFLSSEEYDERAHELYNEGQYDAALDVLREGLNLYPEAVELHIGAGFARLAREEYAWARQSFDLALVLDALHEEALAGLGEALLKFGQRDEALRTFRQILELGYDDDLDLILQVGRALFREEMMEEAREFFEVAAREGKDLPEAAACLGYVHHRLGNDEAAMTHLRRALQLDDEHSEARIYLANILYDRGEYEPALHQLDQTTPEDHWDELGIWRFIELKKSIYKLKDGDGELRPWEARLGELSGDPDDIDEMLADIEQRVLEQEEARDKGQLELFGALLTDLVQRRQYDASEHSILMSDGSEYIGSWERIVHDMREASRHFAGRSLKEYMTNEARRGYSLTGMKIPTSDAESFIRGSANAGLLRIVR